METCSSRVPPLRVPTCAVLTLVRKGCAGAVPLRLGNDRLACYGFVGASNTSPHPSPTATTVFVTGFWQRCAHLPLQEDVFQWLVAGHRRRVVCWRPLLPRPLPYFIQLFLLRLKRLCTTPVDAAILRV